MAKKTKDDKVGIPEKKKRSARSGDDLELIKIILEENGPLRERVLRLLERALKLENGQASRKTS